MSRKEKGVKICPDCNKEKRIYIADLCLVCYGRLNDWRRKFKPKKVERKNGGLLLRSGKKTIDNIPSAQDLYDIKILLIRFKNGLYNEYHVYKLFHLFMEYKPKTVKENYDNLLIHNQIKNMLIHLKRIYHYYKD